MSINNRNEVTCKVVPLTTTNKTLLAGGFDSFMLWHLHANNVTTDPVTVDIYIGDELANALNGLLISLVLPPNGSESIPVSLSQISFPSGSALYAKASVANKANVVINTEVRE